MKDEVETIRLSAKLHKITDIPMCLSVIFSDDSEKRCIINLDMWKKDIMFAENGDIYNKITYINGFGETTFKRNH